MQKDSKHKCNSASHKQLKSNAKNRLDELQDMFSSLQYARKEGQNNTVCELEDQVNQMLKNWKTELNETSSTSSLHGPGSSLGLDSADIRRLLLLSDEEDDATSPLDESKAVQHYCGGQPLQDGDGSFLFQNNPSTNYILQERGFEGSNYVWPNMHDPNLKRNSQAQYHPFELQPSAGGEFIISSDNLDQNLLPAENVLHDFTGFLPAIVQPPPAAFLGSKCALWDCPRPPQTFDQDYCNDIHARLALNEGAAGTSPVLRPGGISLKDSILFDALKAKIQGKEVGIPQCDGAVSARSPWNAPELFDLSLLEGETLREWLFFDKPRKAFESGNRKQRSLPDYSGRGWHESRKQVVKESGGLKRSYYMDPQPVSHLEWHLYEYGIDKCDAQALYRLELKLVDGKKKSKGKVSKDPVADLQTQMGKLTADLPTESKFPKMSLSETGKAGDGCSPSTPFAPDQLTSTAGSVDNGISGVSDDYVNILTDCKRI
uniref:Transcription factor VOZ1 n=1 Tax=Kalanchoe fedtschenkoi TaxID=63787 RepID=A0A7N0TK32_KALFE